MAHTEMPAEALRRHVEIDRVLSKMDAILALVEDASVPENIREAANALRSDVGAWPEWDIGDYTWSLVARDRGSLIGVGQKATLTITFPTDRVVLLHEVGVEPHGRLRLGTMDRSGRYQKYFAQQEANWLSCWKIMRQREGVRLDIENLGTGPFRVERLHVKGYVLDEQ